LFVSSRRRHTRSKRDWSSDVCSSDLTTQGRKALQTRSFRGSKSRNKVSVGEPAEGSLPSYTTPKPTVNLTSVASAGTPRPPAPAPAPDPGARRRDPKLSCITPSGRNFFSELHKQKQMNQNFQQRISWFWHR